ncbi:MAG: phosphopyruvate hydratase, partial [Candidatus Paceibacteria bacterium]
MPKIKDIHALEILDSRGNPTIRSWVELEGGTQAKAAVPSGASTGVHEALELRDEDPGRYMGKGVQKAVKNVNEKISSELKGAEVTDHQNIDQIMLELDGTENKENLGANAILSVSLAVARAAAKAQDLPLYRYIRETFSLDYDGYRFPTPTMNVINGGEHANNSLTAQEFMIVPRLKNFSSSLQAGAEIFHTLESILNNRDYNTGVGDEGGFAPNLNSNEEAIELLLEAIEQAGYESQNEVGLATDIAAGEFYENGKYKFYEDKSPIGIDELAQIVEKWADDYPFVSIEDPLDQDDWEGWQKLTKRIGNKVDVVGDDLFVTNVERLQKGIDMNVANAILIKVNQIGTLSETIDTITTAQKNNYRTSVSHRSGETADTFISDLALAVNSE